MTTRTTYAAVRDAFLETGSIRASARAAGCSFETARKLINEGTATFPPIRQLAEEALAEEARLRSQKLAEELETERQFKRQLYLRLLAKTKPVVERIELDPEGEDDIVDGRPVRKVSAGTFTKVVDGVRAVVELGNELDTPTAPIVGGRTVNIPSRESHPMSVDARAAREAAMSFLKANPILTRVAGTAEEGKVIGGLLAEAHRRGLLDVEEPLQEEEED